MANPILYGTHLDLAQNELRRAVAQVLGTAPSSPVAGQFYYDSTTGAVQWYSAVTSGWINPIARANHTGTQLASTISNLAATVQAYTLDQFAAPAANVNINSKNLINVANPINPTDGANKQYVDNAIQGVETKPSAFYATAAALPANTYANGTSGVGATLTGNANGALATIDGQTPAAGDLVLVKNEATAANNGLYTLTQLGTGSTPYILTRSVDMDDSSEFGGALIAVEKGTAGAGTLWLCAVNSPTVGTTSITFTQLNAATSYTAGNGISIAGNTIAAVATSGGGVIVDGTGIHLDTTIAARKYATTIGDGSTTSFTITHNLGTQDVLVMVHQVASPYSVIYTDVAAATTNTITVAFTVAPTSNQYRVAVIG